MLYAGGVPGNRDGTGRPITHGRYSKKHRETLGTLAENMAAIEDPLNLFPELAQLRAHYVDFINRYDDYNQALLAWYATTRPDYKAVTDDGVQWPAAPPPTRPLDLADGVRILSEISKVVKRIEGIRGRNTISRADFHRVMQEIGRSVEIAVDSQVPEQAEVIKSEISRRLRETRIT
jgi:hypothetical protein